MYDVIVIGAGSAGLFTLANLRKDLKVLGLEKNKVAGKKLKITGGGRCNLTRSESIKVIKDGYTDVSFARPILYAFNNQKLMEYFESRGFHLMEEDNRIYPQSEKASDVVDFFLRQIAQKGHKIYFESEVTDIVEGADSIIVKTKETDYTTKKVIFACGGSAFASTGSDGKLLASVFDITPYQSAMCPLKLTENIYASLKGLSVDVEVKLAKKKLSGALLFAGDFVTGPVIMDTSNYLNVGDSFVVDFIPNINLEMLKNDIKSLAKTQQTRLFKNVLIEKTGLAESFIKVVVGEVMPLETKLADLKAKDLNKLLESLKSKKLTIKQKKPLTQSYVSLGGVKLHDMDNKTLTFKNNDNIYVVGEALDLVGNCGGYNLQFAFSSAYRVVSHINSIL